MRTQGEMEPTQNRRRVKGDGSAEVDGGFPSHHTCLQEEAVMSSTSHLGQWWLEESNRSRGVLGGRGGGGGGWWWGGCGLAEGGLKKLSVLFTMDPMFWPPRLEHNNTYGFKFLPSPYSLLILYQPLSLPLIHHMAGAQRHEFPIY